MHPEQELTWIWDLSLTQTEEYSTATPKALEASTKEWMVIWCNQKAKSERWDEELELVQEEMRRCIAYWTWESMRWLDIQAKRADIPPHVIEGAITYAHRQSVMQTALITKAREHWNPTLEANSLMMV